MIIIGHGAWEARDGIITMAEALGAPVVTTFKGKGLIPDSTRMPAACSAAPARRLPAGS